MCDLFLNNNQLTGYLTDLIAHGLLHYDYTMNTCITTEKGLRLLNLWYNLRDSVIDQLPQQEQHRPIKSKRVGVEEEEEF